MVAAIRVRRRPEGGLAERRQPPPLDGKRAPPSRSATKASPPPLKLADVQASHPAPALGTEFERQDLEHIAELARRYLFSGAATVARDLFRSLHLLRPSESYFALGCGLAEEAEGRLDEARKWYKEAYRLSPDDPWVVLSLSEMCLRSGQLRDARAWVGRVVQLPISDARLRIRLEALARLPVFQRAAP
jgi:Flp pilus assembly protein TadD